MIRVRATGRGVARALALAGLLLFSAAFAAVFAAWRNDRARSWETPRLDPASFVPIGGSGVPVQGRETWLLAIRPGCAHCVAQVDEFLARGRRDPKRPVLALLVVDEPRRPRLESPRWRGTDRVWWDARAIWRERWGRRVYGELLRFDSRGRLMASLAPSEPAALPEP